MKNQPQPEAKLYDVQIVLSARMNQTVMRGVHYGVAQWKKKQLIAAGQMKRQIWIVPHASDPKTIKRH